MTGRHATYADLEALLLRHGFTKRRFEVDHGRTDDQAPDQNGASTRPRKPSFVVPGYAYEHKKSGALVLIPIFDPQDAADRHLVPAQHTLIKWGVMSKDDRDRWLCQMRFPDVCGAAAGAEARKAHAAD
jgi:hypothetical protein